MEKDDEIKGGGNSYDFGARMYDSRIGRWISQDPLFSDYPFASPYNFALNTPIQAIDPDGMLVIIVNGLVVGQAVRSDNRREIDIDSDPKVRVMAENPNYRPYPTHEMNEDAPTYLGESFEYWEGIDDSFCVRWGDKEKLYVNGSDHTWSEGDDRFKAGQQGGYELIEKIVGGDITLTKDETIKLIGHSQGAAYAAGMATVLQEAYNNGTIKNKVEQIAYLAPQEPKEFTSPPGIFSIQYSRKSDKIASQGLASNKPISGGSSFGRINGVTEFVILNDMNGDGDGLISGTRGGHSVGTYSEIFGIDPNVFGGVTKNPPFKSRLTIPESSGSGVKYKILKDNEVKRDNTRVEFKLKG